MKAENERMKSENRALTRVVSKLTANAAAAKAQQQQQQHEQLRQQQQSPPWTLVSGRPPNEGAADIPQWAKIRKKCAILAKLKRIICCTIFQILEHCVVTFEIGFVRN